MSHEQKKKPMSDFYKYDDFDYTYIDPKTGVLKNLLHITDEDTLVFVESGVVVKRLKQLYVQPIEITGIKSLFEIHKYLFQDIYYWAGNKRTVEISKAGKQFFPTSHFENAFNYIDNLILEYKNIQSDNKKQVAIKLADILDTVNYLHPFREGNGRTQREFIRSLALQKNYILNLNPIDDTSVYERYMQGTIDSDLDMLTNLIFELITKHKYNYR